MNRIPPDSAPDDASLDEVDDLYRSAVARDPSRPSDSTRRSIAEHAARLAAERNAQAPPIDLRTARRVPKRAWRPWRPALVGTVAAALLAGLIVIPRLWTPAPTPPPLLAEVAPASRAARSAAVADAPLAKYALAPAPAPAPAPAQAPALGSALSADAAQSRARQTVDPALALRRAAQAGDIAAVNRALHEAVDIDARDEGGRTALMLAILNGQGAAVDVLLAHGADPNVSDAAGTTPLAAAVARADVSMVSALRRAGARAAQ